MPPSRRKHKWQMQLARKLRELGLQDISPDLWNNGSYSARIIIGGHCLYLRYNEPPLIISASRVSSGLEKGYELASYLYTCLIDKHMSLEDALAYWELRGG